MNCPDGALATWNLIRDIDVVDDDSSNDNYAPRFSSDFTNIPATAQYAEKSLQSDGPQLAIPPELIDCEDLPERIPVIWKENKQTIPRPPDISQNVLKSFGSSKEGSRARRSLAEEYDRKRAASIRAAMSNQGLINSQVFVQADSSNLDHGTDVNHLWCKCIKKMMRCP